MAPTILWIPYIAAEGCEHIEAQLGAFTTEAEALAVLDVWASEGHADVTGVNIVPLHGSVAEWHEER